MFKKLCSIVLAVAFASVLAPLAFAANTDPGALFAGLAVAGSIFIGDIQFVTSKTLREQRANLVDTNGKLLAKIAAETDQARVKELETEWDKRDNDILDLDKKIERAERQEKLELEAASPANPNRRSGRTPPAGDGSPNADQIAEQRERYKRAYWDNLRGFEISPEDRQLLGRRFRTVRGDVINLGETRAMSTTTSAGGYAIPEGFVPQLEASMLAFGGVRPVATIMRTDKGNTLPWPTVNDTGNEAAIVSEGSALTSPQDPPFGVVSFGSYMYRTLVLASFELLQDEGVNLEAFIMSAIAERFARGTNRHYTVGNGTTQPHGFVPASSSGVTAASATSVSYEDLVDLEHSVDPAYRQGASFQMRDSTLKIIKKLLDGDNRPLWASGIAVKEPNTILGYSYQYNEHMAAVQASNKSVAFGNFKKFMIRDVQDLLIVRANELHLANGQVGFYAFWRTDSKLLDAGTDPIKHLTHPSPN